MLFHVVIPIMAKGIHDSRTYSPNNITNDNDTTNNRNENKIVPTSAVPNKFGCASKNNDHTLTTLKIQLQRITMKTPTTIIILARPPNTVSAKSALVIERGLSRSSVLD